MPITNFDQVELLLPMTGANNGTVFADYSLRQRTVTRTGAVTSTAQSKFSAYGSSGFFDGINDYLTVPDSDGLDFGAKDFCIDGWIRPNALGSAQVIFEARANVTDFRVGLVLRVEAGAGLRILASDTANPGSYNLDITTSGTVALNTWAHMAFVRNGSAWNIYINGVSSASATASFTVGRQSDVKRIGIQFDGTSAPLSAYMQDFRITVGDPVYTANFTPPARMTQRELTRTNTGTDSHVYDRAVLFDWNAGGGSTSKAVIPDEDGDFEATGLIDLQYGIAHLKSGCAPICHGPYSVDADA